MKTTDLVMSRPCPLCEASSATIIATMSAEQIIESSVYYDKTAYTNLGVQPGDRYGISRCNHCNFVFSSAVPDDEFLNNLYGSHSDIEAAVNVFARPNRAAFAFQSMSNLLAALSRKHACNEKGVSLKRPKILDFGCAYGVGSLGLAQTHYPYEISGVEWSQSTRDYLCDQGMTVYSDLKQVPTGTYFDGILLNDILEHLPDPVALIKQLAKLSHKNTIIRINVPNFIDWRLDDIVDKVNAGRLDVPKDMNPWEHLSYFSPTTLNRVMKTGGYIREPEMQINYPVSIDSPKQLLITTLKAIRDIFRTYQKKYPDNYSTSAIYSRKE